MKTFEEYINETRQNYIFGGTDDRNTKQPIRKTFGELEKGDFIYIYAPYWNSEVIRKYKFISYSNISNHPDFLYMRFKKTRHNSTRFTEDDRTAIEKSDLDEEAYINRDGNMEDGKIICITTTSLEAMQDELYDKLEIDANKLRVTSEK